MARPNRDGEHLKKLRDYFALHRLLPSYAGIAALLGFSGKTGAVRLVERLVETGYVEHAPGGKLVPADKFFELPLVDQQAPAGPGEPDQVFSSLEAFSLDRLLVGDHAKTVLVPIRGDSMVDAGVLDGDTAIVERTESPRAGDFVIAAVDGQYTIKELRFERSKPVLIPHNNQYEPIRPRQEFLILGVVKGIVRRYDRPGATAKA
ncbi:repressor LexA [Pelomonas aquatica]|uniref:Repressor LexA n=1 Tax=Pelomonas aquatica TaxID=431058 RepID=A0ABU1ZC94_9BURK|nr:S24 family peptidase [Pelomonas aquatica]MDR7298248.1 repressor LexA [Pelomonas aquatica]